MITGILLIFIGTFFGEINNSITKNKTKKYQFLKIGVITSFFSAIFFLTGGAYKYFFTELSIYLNPESVPLLILRIVLEVFQAYITILAIKHSDRSTYSIIKILTIPGLVIIDMLLGYQFTTYSLIGILLILTSFLLFNLKQKTLNFKGWYFSLFTAINAIFTISLFKYSLDNYGNSVEVDQFIMTFSILVFFLVYNYIKNKTCALKLIKEEKNFITMGVSIGLYGLVASYAYLYLNASEAMAATRGMEMVWAILAGTIFFQEKGVFKKLLLAFFIMLGLVIMIY